MNVYFNGLKVIDCAIVDKKKRIARTILRSETAEIVATLPLKDNENTYGFSPKASESYSMTLSTRYCFPRNGVYRELEVVSFSVDADNIDESSTRINVLLTNEFDENRDPVSEIELNWCEDSENYKEILDNLEVGNVLYVSTELETNSNSSTEVGR